MLQNYPAMKLIQLYRRQVTLFCTIVLHFSSITVLMLHKTNVISAVKQRYKTQQWHYSAQFRLNVDSIHFNSCVDISVNIQFKFCSHLMMSVQVYLYYFWICLLTLVSQRGFSLFWKKNLLTLLSGYNCPPPTSLLSGYNCPPPHTSSFALRV